MKKLVFTILLINSYILLSSNAHSVSIYYPSLTIYPEPPLTTLDAIYAQLSGEFATTGFEIDGDPSVTLSGNNIDIAISYSSPSEIVLPVLVSFSVDAEIGLLDEGTYNVNARIFVDNILEHRLNDSFTVSAIPLPTAIWLFGSGLIGLIGFARRKD